MANIKEIIERMIQQKVAEEVNELVEVATAELRNRIPGIIAGIAIQFSTHIDITKYEDKVIVVITLPFDKTRAGMGEG